MSASGLPPRPENPVFQVTGLSWVRKHLKVPSRNSLIFISVTSSILGAYIYDRQQCRKIRDEYIDKVKYLSEETADHLGWPRKVTVYGAKWPGDEDYEQCIKYFRKYVKPVFVAAAVDYEIVMGKKHGELAARIAEDIKKRRRLEAGMDQERSRAEMPPAYQFRSKKVLRQQELEGGIVIVGRPTWKEFMAGVRRGWSESPAKVDLDEILARDLEADNTFDDLPVLPAGSEESSQAENVQSYTPLRQAMASSSTIPIDPQMPESIPISPPILFVTFTDYIGIKLIPNMIYNFFNQRHLVRSGAHAAYQLVMKQTRPFQSPSSSLSLFSDVGSADGDTKTDLNFDKHSEGYYKKSLDDLDSEIDKSRKKYYTELEGKLKIARELSSGEREPTKEDTENPPPTEVELRAERMTKEKRWRSMLAGWDIVKPSAEVAWDKRFENIFTVFTDPTESSITTTNTTKTD